MTPEYERTTRASSLEALDAPVREALVERIEAALLTLGDSPAVFVTHARQVGGAKKRGLFRRATGVADPDDEHVQVLVIGVSDLLVARHGASSGTAVLAARLEDLEVEDLLAKYGSLAPAGAASGLSLNGFPVSGPDGGRGSYFVGLGAPDEDSARAAVTEAIRRAKAA